jgi:HEAT repeat protein
LPYAIGAAGGSATTFLALVLVYVLFLRSAPPAAETAPGDRPAETVAARETPRSIAAEVPKASARAPSKPAARPTPTVAVKETPARPSSPAPIGIPGATAVAPAEGPELHYAWKPGETYVYAVHVAIDGGNLEILFDGSSVYKVRSANEKEITLGHRGWLTTRKRSKDGTPVSGEGAIGPNGNPPWSELTIDSKGNLVNASGSHPLPMLGDLAMLVIEPFPEGAEAAWEESNTIRVVERDPSSGGEGGPLRFGRPSLRERLQQRNRPRGIPPRSRGGRVRRTALLVQAPAESSDGAKVYPATEHASFTLASQSGDTAIIAKTYELRTEATNQGEPYLLVTGEGTLTFDFRAGVPRAFDYRLKVVQTTGNATFRVPIAVQCKLLDGRERELALVPPALPPTLLSPIAPKSLTAALADVGSPDNGRRERAQQILFNAVPIEAKRSEVARALEAHLDDPGYPRGNLVRAVGVWGDRETVPLLIDRLSQPSYGARGELIEALARLGPDDRTLALAATWLASDAHAATQLLRPMGPAAEPALLKVVQGDGDGRARAEACKLLRELGTKQSLPVLQALVARKSDGELGRIAEEALKAIARRRLKDEDFGPILADLKSNDVGVRWRSIDRLEAADPVAAHRAEVARVLETMAVECPDGGQRDRALGLLRTWGDSATPVALAKILEDPTYPSWRQAIEVTKQARLADAALAKAVARWAKQDRGHALSTLERMGPVAEPAALTLFRERDPQDGGYTADLCRLLGAIGGKASASALRALAAAPSASASREAQEALKALAESPEAKVDRLVADLKTNDHGRIRSAVAALKTMRPIEPRRAAVARALEAFYGDRDGFFVEEAIRATAVWGDARSVDALLPRLEDPNFWAWGEALVALGSLHAGDRAAPAAVKRLTVDSGKAMNGLKTLGPAAAQAALIDAMKPASDSKLRLEACRALGALGGPEAIPALESLARQAGIEGLAQEAEEALKAIASR